jgi:hypothetical protein
MSRSLFVFALLSAMSAVSSRASAQACAVPEHPFFEFQVDQPAAYLGDTARVPRPTEDRLLRISQHPEALVVQFVVDTLGVPDVRSFHVLQSLSMIAADSVRAAFSKWRFSPAIRAGCRVPQVIQTFITH